MATDLPSGVDADTGVVEGAAIKADVTVTFGTLKPGLLVDPGASYSGTVHLVDIGLGPHLTAAPAVAALQAADVAGLLPRPGAESDKYRRGVLGVLAGSQRYTGAAVLSVGGAIRGGAGMVRLVSARAAADVVRQHWPEAVITVIDPADPAEPAGPAAVAAAGRVQAWVAGPGLGTDDEAAALLAAVLATPLPVLVDADGLTVLSRRKELLSRPAGAATLITPHAGELARLLDADHADIEAHRLDSARRAATELGVTVLLKGSTTVIATPDSSEPAYVNPTGTPWLATAGSGDVLSGLAGAMLAQGVLPARSAAAAAAFLHGLAGRAGGGRCPDRGGRRAGGHSRSRSPRRGRRPLALAVRTWLGTGSVALGGRVAGRSTETAGQRVAKHRHVAGPCHAGEARPVAGIPREPAWRHETGGGGVRDEERRDGHDQLIGKPGGQELGVHGRAALDQQPGHTARRQIGQDDAERRRVARVHDVRSLAQPARGRARRLRRHVDDRVRRRS